MLTGTPFSMQAYIGVIMLAGIVVSNAILLVDYTNTLRRRDGMELRAAIELAGRHRLRPILMTSLCTGLGLVPMAIGIGEGAELQAPLARVVIGGLLTSTLITLVFVPAMYTLFEEGWRGDLQEGSRGAALLPKQRTDRLAGRRVNPARRHLRERLEHEEPLAKSRMRNHQPGSSIRASPNKIKSRSSVRGAIGARPGAPGLPLDREQPLEQLARGQRGLADHHAVQVARLIGATRRPARCRASWIVAGW